MFFSVRNTIKIEGKVYSPCICYMVTEYLKLTVDKLVAEGKADQYDERVFFCNGKIVEKKEESEKTGSCEKCDNNLGNGKCLGSSGNGLVDTTGELKCFEKKGKKEKKEKTLPAIAEDIPSPEEIADNEDF